MTGLPENDPYVYKARSELWEIVDWINSGGDTGAYIDAVGIQSHFGCDFVAQWDAGSLLAIRTDIVLFFETLVEKGLSIHISEIDWTGCRDSHDKWKVLSHLQFSACLNQPACESVGIWAVADPFQWIETSPKLIVHDTLFAEDGSPHPSYFGLVDALLGRKPSECSSSRSFEMQEYCSLPVLPVRQKVLP